MTHHFTITGEAMTEIARDLLLSDEPGKAYRLLADHLIGEGANMAAVGVLTGTHALEGDNHSGIDLVESSAVERERFEKCIAEIYAGRVRVFGKWMRPAAVVRTFSVEDAKWASKKARTVNGKASKFILDWKLHRASYYRKDSEHIEFLEVPGQEPGFVIFEPCSELPHWMEPAKNYQDAVRQFIESGRTLWERGVAKIDEDDFDSDFEDWDTQDDDKCEYENRYEGKIESLAQDIKAQAGSDTFILKVSEDKQLVVPRAPFIRWALRNCDDISSEAPDWKNVSPSGLKMMSDDPNHTDWVLGSGLSLEEAYDEDLRRASWDEAFRIQEELRASKEKFSGIRAAMEMLSNSIHKAATIVDAGVRSGLVGQDIAVFPDSSPHRASMLDGKSGVIVEEGGKLAHFAVVSKGKGITVMRCKGACTLFEEGQRVTLNPKTGRITVEDEDDET